MQSAWKMSVFLTLLVLFYAGFGAIIYWQLTHFAQLVETLHDHPMTVTKGTLTANRDVLAISRNAKDMLLVDDMAHRRKRLLEIVQYEKEIDQNISLVLDRIEGDEGKVLVRKAMEDINAQKNLRERITTEIFSGDIKKAGELARVEGTALMKQLEEIMVKIANYADSKSMEYHVESVNDLRRAKVILLSAGLIVLILSLTFAVAAWRSLKRSLDKTKGTLNNAAKSPIDFTVIFDTPSPGEVGESLNVFFSQISGIMSNIRERHDALSSKINDMALDWEHLPVSMDEISAKIDVILDKIVTVLDIHHDGQKSYQLPFDLLKQIKGDLSLLAQIAATKDLLIERLKFGKDASPADFEGVLESLKVHTKSMRENIDRTSRSVDSVIDLLKSLLDRLNDLRATTLTNQDVWNDVQILKEHNASCEELVTEMKVISQQTDLLLKEFKET